MRSNIQNKELEFLTSTFLEEGLNSQQIVALKELLRNKDTHDYFRQAYQLWHLNFYQEEKSTEQAFQKTLVRIQSEKDKSKRRKSVNFSIVAAACILAFVLGAGIYHLTFNLNKTKFANTNVLPFESPVVVSVCRVSAPLGSKSIIELADGSTVTLNAGSQIEYSSDYGIQNRNIKLTGEGYFKVSKNKNIPFIVNAKSTTIKALGTEFNVKAYSDENFVQTTLVQGSVSINPNIHSNKKEKDIILIPNEMLTIHGSLAEKQRINSLTNTIAIQPKPILKKEDGMTLTIKDTEVSRQTVKTVLYTSWKDSRWVIEGEGIESLAQKLERRFGVEFIVANPELTKYKFSGILENETLEQTLEILKTVTPINFKIDKKLVFINIDQEQKKAFEKSMNK